MTSERKPKLSLLMRPPDRRRSTSCMWDSHLSHHPLSLPLSTPQGFPPSFATSGGFLREIRCGPSAAAGARVPHQHTRQTSGPRQCSSHLSRSSSLSPAIIPRCILSVRSFSLSPSPSHHFVSRSRLNPLSLPRFFPFLSLTPRLVFSLSLSALVTPLISPHMRSCSHPAPPLVNRVFARSRFPLLRLRIACLLVLLCPLLPSRQLGVSVARYGTGRRPAGGRSLSRLFSPLGSPLAIRPPLPMSSSLPSSFLPLRLGPNLLSPLPPSSLSSYPLSCPLPSSPPIPAPFPRVRGAPFHLFLSSSEPAFLSSNYIPPRLEMYRQAVNSGSGLFQVLVVDHHLPTTRRRILVILHTNETCRYPPPPRYRARRPHANPAPASRPPLPRPALSRSPPAQRNS
ncbi:cytosolic phospholipase A2 [Penaeus vannamei]|uniref:Cytosolic phospholipase A2 n=1 Tax=Penaeus vannamei TaxID=6689 RepID=A0A3R7SYS7_PENVA|nr:cytosolic phospholipase A2 [Penaeus vannamei]